MLIEKAALLTSLVKPGGWLVLSGILDEQSDLVMAAYRDQFHFEPAQKQEEWVLLAAQKL
jgi:ribosomal protein L11 methyltransferase